MSEAQINVIPDKVNTLVGRVLYRISRATAILGGFIFLILIALSLYSLSGRKLGFGGINGDIEIMQAGCAVAASLFLPFCTIMYEHLKVDFFTMKLASAIRNRLDALADFLLFIVALLLVYRITLQSVALYEFGEVTALVSIPVWLPNLLLVPGFALTAVCSLYYCVIHSMNRG